MAIQALTQLKLLWEGLFVYMSLGVETVVCVRSL
jgi:hypothetical protein